MKYTAIILAGGNSSRFGDKNKLLFKINDKFVIELAVQNFLKDIECTKIIIVINSKFKDTYRNIFVDKKIKLVNGGNTRHNSFLNGFINCMSSEYVMVHDAARPFVTFELISNIKKEFLIDQNLECVIPVLTMNDSIFTINNNKIKYLNRDKIKIVQTPQMFKTNLIKSILKNDNRNYNDEFSWIISNKEIKYKLISGDKNNFKITYRKDVT